jgi:hypothetical protein
MRWPNTPKQSKCAFHRAAETITSRTAVTGQGAHFLYCCLRLTESLTIRNAVAGCTGGTVSLEDVKKALGQVWSVAIEDLSKPPSD